MWIRISNGHTVPRAGSMNSRALHVSSSPGESRPSYVSRGPPERFPSVKADGPGRADQTGEAPSDLDLRPFGLIGPEVIVTARDLNGWLMSLLGWELREIAKYRSAGETIDQIAKRRRRWRGTIERMINEIQQIWDRARRDAE